MIIKTMTVGMFASNCYLIGCKRTFEGMVIDPGADGKAIVQETNNLGLDIKYIVNTHGHVDHVAANAFVKRETGAQILLHKNDLDIYQKPGLGLLLVRKSPPPPDRFIEEGDRIIFGELEMKVIETPGHTRGGISLVMDQKIFTGDSLFAGSIGRTDMKGSSYVELISSIKEKLLVFPDDTVIYPGHGPASTIGHEKKYNPFL